MTTPTAEKARGMMDKFRVCLSFGNSIMEMHLLFDNLTKEEAATLIRVSEKFNNYGGELNLEGWSTQPMESVNEEEIERL